MVENENTLKEYRFVIITGTITVIVVIMAFFFVMIPLWNAQQKTSTELGGKMAYLNQLNIKLANLKTLKDKEADIKAKNVKVMAALPTDKDVARLFVQFDKVGAESGLTVKSSSEGGTTAVISGTTSALVKPVTYTSSNAGTNYATLKTALAKFEKALRVVSVPIVTVNGKGDGSGLEISFSVLTYSRGQNWKRMIWSKTQLS